MIDTTFATNTETRTNPSRYRANSLSKAALHAIYKAGLATVGSWEPSGDSLTAYSPKGKKSVVVTKADIEFWAGVWEPGDKIARVK